LWRRFRSWWPSPGTGGTAALNDKKRRNSNFKSGTASEGRSSDLYEDDRVLQIVQEELQKHRHYRKPIGEVLDDLMYLLVERIEIEEEQ